MALNELKITEKEINENNVKSAADTYDDGDVRSNKNIFDRLPELIARRLNRLIDRVKKQMDNTYSREETDKAIAEKVVEIGSGDMARAIYDTDGDGMVDKAGNGIHVYTHSSYSLTGSGVNGRVKATGNGTYTEFAVNGESYAVKAGDDTTVEFVTGVWYTFVLDLQAKTINFKRGGGVSKRKLAQATAVESDVRKGKTFYAGDKGLKTGEGGVGATGYFASKSNQAVNIETGFRPKMIMLYYTYLQDGTGSTTVIIYDADKPESYQLGYGNAGYYRAEQVNEDGGIYGYITVNDNGFSFKGYYTSSGERTVRYVCY